MTRVECFLDTNFLIHFKPLNEVDWLALTSSTDVVLTIPMTVIHELDEKKELGKTLRLRKRAQDVLRRLNEWSQQGERPAIRPGVSLRLVAEEPIADWEALRLDSHVSDDRIIGALLTQRLSSDSAVFLVTADFGARLKCQARKISVINPPDEYRQPDVMGEYDREVAELRRRLAGYEEREPDLILELLGPASRGRQLELELVRPVWASDEGIEKALQEEEQKLKSVLVSRGNTPSLVSGLVDPKDEERFRQAIPDYLSDYRAYLEKDRTHLLHAALTVKLQCVLLNGGHAPAEGIEIGLHVPDGPDVFDEESLPRAPEAPDRPVTPRTAIEIMRDGLAFSMPQLARPYEILGRLPNLGGDSLAPRITKGNSHHVEYSHTELQHGFEVTFNPFYCSFPNPEAVRSFTMDYEIHAKNLAEPATGQLPLILRLGSTSTD